MQHRALALVLLSGLFACGDNMHDGATGSPDGVVTSLTPDPLTAGDMLVATCTVYDAHDNVLAGFTPSLTISPAAADTTITGLSAIVTKAGHYAGQCSIPELAGDFAPLDVVHALPAHLVIGKAPDQQVYRIAVAVQITHAITDKYGNDIFDAVVTNDSTAVTGMGPVMTSAPDTFMYGSEGTYHVQASVAPLCARMAQMLGSTVASMLGRSLADFLDEPGRVRLGEVIESHKRGLSVQDEVAFLHRDLKGPLVSLA